MARPAQKEIAPWMQQIMRARNWDCLAKVQKETKIPLTTLRRWALSDTSGAVLQNILEMADALQVPVELLMRAILGQVDLSVILKRSAGTGTISESNVKEVSDSRCPAIQILFGSFLNDKTTLPLRKAA